LERGAQTTLHGNPYKKNHFFTVKFALSCCGIINLIKKTPVSVGKG